MRVAQAAAMLQAPRDAEFNADATGDARPLYTRLWPSGFLAKHALWQDTLVALD